MAKNKKTTDISGLYNMKQVSEKLSMSVKQIDRLIEKGDLLGVFKISKTRYIDREDLLIFINEQKRKSDILS